MISFPLSRALRICAQHRELLQPGVMIDCIAFLKFHVKGRLHLELLECTTRVSRLRSQFEYRSVIKQDNEKDLPVADTNGGDSCLYYIVQFANINLPWVEWHNVTPRLIYPSEYRG